ncbi:MAG: S8 family peptidase [Bacillota bacterium]
MNIKKYLLISIIIFIFSLIIFYYPVEIAEEDNPVIFVIDSKVDQSFLEKPIARLEVDSSHGNKVVATIRTQTQSEIIPLSAENFLGKIDKDNYIAALEKIKEYSEDNPNKRILLNISLGFSEKDFQEKIITELAKKNIIIIAAAGNNNDEEKLYPAGFTDVLAVAALEKNKKMPGSNFGEYVDISASGIIRLNETLYLPSTNLIQTTKITGTSFAAPQVTGLLAKMMSYNKNLEIEEAVQLLKNSAAKIDDQLYRENKLGAGKISKLNALSRASKVYFFGQILVFLSALTFFTLLFIFLWRKISFGAILVFALGLILLLIIQPVLVVLYRIIGVQNIIIISAGLAIFYYIFKKVVSYYLEKTEKISSILFLSYLLRNELRLKAVKRIVFLINNKNDYSEENIINKLNKTFSPVRAKFYIKILLRIKNPPISILIRNANYYNFKGNFIAEEMGSVKRTKKENSKIIGELLYYLFADDYKKAKMAADIARNYSNSLILVPLKNILNKREKIVNNEKILHFSLEIVESFGPEAADFSAILKSLIVNSESHWLRYYALKAYLAVASNDKDYEEFIAHIKEVEEEPVILALDNK